MPEKIHSIDLGDVYSEEELKAKLTAKLGALISQFGGLGDQQGPERSEPWAQARELLVRYAVAQEPSDLKPGDVCVEREGFQSANHVGGHDLVYVIWAELDMSNPNHVEILTFWHKEFAVSPDYDVIVGYMPTRQHNHLHFRPHSRRYLQLAVSNVGEH